MKTRSQSIQSRLEEIKAKIAAAAAKSGRNPSEIEIVAVTKGATAMDIREAYAAGLCQFGENRVQEAETKITALADLPLFWHMVGHLQTNKIKTALPLFSVFQSIDSVRLAKELGAAAMESGKIVSVLLEINISGEAKKFGFKPEEIYTAAEEIKAIPGLKVEGLMGIGPLAGGEEATRQSFKKLKGIFSVCKTFKASNFEMKYLSMGMSQDFEIAVEEGSNRLRIGRALFK